MSQYLGRYANDGKCHNAQRGTHGHECGKPATWIGATSMAFRSGFCDHCREHGDEANSIVKWERIKPLGPFNLNSGSSGVDYPNG